MLYSKLYVLASLMLGSYLVGVCRAQAAGSEYFYSIPEPDRGYDSGNQWRPTNGQQSSDDVDVRPFRGRAELLTDRRQQKWDLPPDTYRPIKGPQTLIPQVEAYRFRTIAPEEQSHYVITGAGKGGARNDLTPKQLRFRGEGSRQNLWYPGARYQPRFRPDNELSGSTYRPATAYQQNKQRAYSDPIYSAPVFREGAGEGQ